METLKLVVKSPAPLDPFEDFIYPSRQTDIPSGLEFQYFEIQKTFVCPCPICFTHGDMSPVPVTFWLQYPASQHFVSFMIRTELMGWKSSWSKYWIVPSSELVYICHQPSGNSLDLEKSRSFRASKLRYFFDGKVTLKSSILICFQYNWTEWYFSSHCLSMAVLLLTILRHEARGIIDEACKWSSYIQHEIFIAHKWLTLAAASIKHLGPGSNSYHSN